MGGITRFCLGINAERITGQRDHLNNFSPAPLKIGKQWRKVLACGTVIEKESQQYGPLLSQSLSQADVWGDKSTVAGVERKNIAVVGIRVPCGHGRWSDPQQQAQQGSGDNLERVQRRSGSVPAFCSPRPRP